LDGWSESAKDPAFQELARAVHMLLGEAKPEHDARPIDPRSGKPSVCVLPFVNISGDPEQEYFSDGISEDIITDLGKVSALSVVARNTAFTYKGKPIAIAQVARQLCVSHVVEGSVRKAGNRVRITAQLIDGAAGDHLWAERWDRDLTDIFALQDEISQAIVAALKLKLLPEEKKAIEKRGTDNPEAYDLYLMARRHWKDRASNRRELVVRLCRGAIDLDPSFARAWALMAVCQSRQVKHMLDGGDERWASAERALALDPELAEAHAAKGMVLTYAGRMDEAQVEIDIALRLDPGSPDVNIAAGMLAQLTRRFAEALRHWDVSAAADQTECWGPFMAIQCYQALGDQAGVTAAAQETLTRVEKALAAEPDVATVICFGVRALLILGEPEKANTWARKALALDHEDSVIPYNLACAMAQAGETDYALDLLEDSVGKAAGGTLMWAQRDSDLDPLRELPRFQAIIPAAEAGFDANG
jgi:TolB-like protein/Tfp pilus assembly protein PilF